MVFMTDCILNTQQCMHQFHYINVDMTYEDVRQNLMHLFMGRKRYQEELVSAVIEDKNKDKEIVDENVVKDLLECRQIKKQMR